MKYLMIVILVVLSSCLPKVEEVIEECPKTAPTVSAVKVIQEKIVELKCNDIPAYQCDVREFSPEIATEKELKLEHCVGSGCLHYDRYSFSTSSMKRKDSFSTEEDFERGGQYNYQEVLCWSSSFGSQKVTGEGEEIDDALDRAIAACEKEVEQR